jgi:hypothetical protein
MSRKQLENFLEQEKRITLGSSITKFVIDAEASDEERGKLKREQFSERMARTRKKRATKRKAQKKMKLKRKMRAEQEMVHIDEMLKSDSGSQVKVRRTERHQLTAKMGKAVKKAANSQRNAKQIETGNGKRLGRTQWPDHGPDG